MDSFMENISALKRLLLVFEWYLLIRQLDFRQMPIANIIVGVLASGYISLIAPVQD